MPYSSVSELPDAVKDAIPAAVGRRLFLNVFNSEQRAGRSEARSFAAAWSALQRAGYEKNADDQWVKKSLADAFTELVDKLKAHGSDSESEEEEEEEDVVLKMRADISKVDEDQRLVFGWFTVIEEDGRPVVDHERDVIDSLELEKAAYSYVLDARVAGERHVRKGVGRLVESVVFTKEKQDLLGIDLGKVGWWGGYYVDDDEVWDLVKSGEYRAFSIGGNAHRVVVE